MRLMRPARSLLIAIALSVPRLAGAQGAPVGPEFRVNTYTIGSQGSNGSVASDGMGNFIVVWQSPGQDGSAEGIFGQRYDSTGAPLGSEFRVNSYTTNEQSFPSVAADSSGNFVVMWRSYGQDGSRWGVFGQRYSVSGAPIGPEFRANAFTTLEQQGSKVAFDALGNFVVVWSSYAQDGAIYGIFGQRYAATGAPLGPEFRVNTYTTSNQTGPLVATDASGNFVVVWNSDHDGSARGVFGQRYAASGAPLGSEFRVNSYTTDDQLVSSVSSDPSGNFVVVWSSDLQVGEPPSGGENQDVFGQRYASSGTPLGAEFLINTYVTQSQSRASVASDGLGNFVVVWHSLFQDGANYGVFGQRYLTTGAPLGPEFRVNTYTTNTQATPGVAADSSGNFVVVWNSYGQDGSYGGVFGQRYAPIVPVELTQFKVE